MTSYVHPSAQIDDDVAIGEDTKIWHLSYIRRGSKIGSECNIGRGVFMDPDVVVGNRVKIGNYACIFEGVTIEDGVFVGPHVVFTNDKLPRAVNPDGTIKLAEDWIITPTRIREGAALGANSTIICGITVGRWAMIGAGSVVTKDVPDHGLVIGNPARLVGYVCKCGERMPVGVDPTTYICDCDK